MAMHVMGSSQCIGGTTLYYSNHAAIEKIIFISNFAFISNMQCIACPPRHGIWKVLSENISEGNRKDKQADYDNKYVLNTKRRRLIVFCPLQDEGQKRLIALG